MYQSLRECYCPIVGINLKVAFATSQTVEQLTVHTTVLITGCNASNDTSYRIILWDSDSKIEWVLINNWCIIINIRYCY